MTAQHKSQEPILLGALDLHLWGEGRHEKLWNVLGAHLMVRDGVAGAGFAVWAPHAKQVRVVGDFNGWHGDRNPMARRSAGLWETFVPAASFGDRYKFEIQTAVGEWVLRADPMARWAEEPPATASRIFESSYRWSDQDWMRRRAEQNPHLRPLTVYEVHLGSWRLGMDYRRAADELVKHVNYLGFTHVEFMPLAEHPYGGSWGYQVTGYYAPTSRYGNPDDLKYLIDSLHAAGIGVIMDWVPAHFPRDEWALARFDGEPLYEDADPRRGEHPDWGTLVFAFGSSQVRNFLVANALYWFEEFHVDGLRVDAVASMLYLDYSRDDGHWAPNAAGGRENLDAVAMLQEVTATAYRTHPGILMIAEESTAWPGVTRATDSGGLGFGLKWNMGWMHDTLTYLQHEPVHRSHHHGQLTFSLHYAWSEQFLLPLSHDEVVHGKGSLLGKMPGDRGQQLATLRAYFAWMWAHPGKKLLFMGGEFAQPGEWSEQYGLDWAALDWDEHRGVQALVVTLNGLMSAHPELWELDFDPTGFEWIDSNDGGQNIAAFLRRDSDGNALVGVWNFSGIAVHGYRLALPEAGTWLEILNTDGHEFGGGDGGNFGRVTADPVAHFGRPASGTISVPALSAIWFAKQRPSG